MFENSSPSIAQKEVAEFLAGLRVAIAPQINSAVDMASFSSAADAVSALCSQSGATEVTCMQMRFALHDLLVVTPESELVSEAFIYAVAHCESAIYESASKTIH